MYARNPPNIINLQNRMAVLLKLVKVPTLSYTNAKSTNTKSISKQNIDQKNGVLKSKPEQMYEKIPHHQKVEKFCLRSFQWNMDNR